MPVRTAALLLLLLLLLPAGAEAQTVEDLKRLLAEAPPACDQIAFTFLGLSLAGWNVIAGIALASYAAAAALGLGWRTGPDRAALSRRA